MSKVTIIIGLPGSGKSTFLHTLNTTKGNIIMMDYGWRGNYDSSFNEEYRFENLINFIKEGKNILMDGSCFCNHKFLCEAEYHLNLHFPNIEIEKIYFENNPKDSEANVLYREYVGGNHWKLVDGNLIFFGHHFMEEGPNKGRRMYEVIINNIHRLSKDYIIPDRFVPKKVELQDEKFYEGWRALIRQ